jgi:hypothetical protein
MRNTGEVVSADAHVVCKQDRFEYRLGDNASIEHEPPPLGQDRGEIVGAYAIIRLKSGEVLRDVMSKQEIEQTRSQSRAKDSLMWSKFYAEAARKTVLRRCSKAAPQTADAERLFARDDDDLEDGANMAAPAGFPPLTELPIAEPEPIREPDGEVVEDEPSFEVTDLDGEVFAFHEAKVAAKALRSLYADAASRGPQFVAGAVESNRAVQEQLEQAGERFEMPAEKKPAAPVPLVDDDPPFPGDLPSTQSLAIPVPRRMPADKPDYRGWALGMLLPRVRQANSSADLGMLLGDNEEALTQAKRALAAADRQELDREIAARWDEIAEIERAPA